MHNKESNIFSALNGFLYEGEKKPLQFIIFTKKIHPRLVYACRFIFHQNLLSNFRITENETEFINSDLIKINYSDKTIPDIVSIIPSGFLNETGVKEFVPPVKVDNNSIYFFPNETEIGYDVFSMVFYFISRYEEWQKYTKDDHGRFEVRNSILYKLSALKTPLLDFRLQEFRKYLLNKYPFLQLPSRKFRYISTIDVDNVYAYKAKPFFRNAGGAMKDLLRGNIIGLFHRLGTVFLNKKDPFDNYDLLTEISKKNNIPLICFFLCRNNTTYDRSINPKHPYFTALLHKLIDDGISIGIHPSYFSSEDKELLSKEIKLFTKNSGSKVILSRQHYLKFNIKTTPGELFEQGIKFDFTMGFAGKPGYRAGTGLPFYYYDFGNEKEMEIIAVPFSVMDGAYYIYNKAKQSDAQNEILEMAQVIKELNGLFITVFHERSFSELHYPGWKKLYILLMDSLKEIN